MFLIFSEKIRASSMDRLELELKNFAECAEFSGMLSTTKMSAEVYCTIR